MGDIFDPAAKGASLGLWISLPDRLATETVARAGFDFVILDLQHGGMGWDAILPAIQTLDLHAVPAFVRVVSNESGQIMRALDLGARGVIVPLVNTAQEAAAAARATRYPPDGDRSFGPVRSYYSPGAAEIPQPLCFVMIETVEAMNNLDAIASVPGVDGLFVGPVDLALSMGFSQKEALGFPDVVLQAVERVVAVGADKGVIAGCPAFGLANGKALAARGVRFLPIGSDAGLLRRQAAADLSEARSWAD